MGLREVVTRVVRNRLIWICANALVVGVLVGVKVATPPSTYPMSLTFHVARGEFVAWACDGWLVASVIVADHPIKGDHDFVRIERDEGAMYLLWGGGRFVRIVNTTSRSPEIHSMGLRDWIVLVPAGGLLGGQTFLWMKHRRRGNRRGFPV